MAKHKGGAGRNKEKCARYKKEGRREKNIKLNQQRYLRWLEKKLKRMPKYGLSTSGIEKEITRVKNLLG